MKDSSNSLLGASVLTAIAASICCITPVLAMLGGIAGIASAFSWLEPLRLYLVGITILVLGFAWYKALKPKKQGVECACEGEVKEDKKGFLNTKGFLIAITILSVLLMTFPYYSKSFFPSHSPNQVQEGNSSAIKEAKFNVKGMTCAACEEHVKHALNQVPGVIETSANYASGTASVKYDSAKADIANITKAINGTGYKVY